jgi:exonuclease III
VYEDFILYNTYVPTLNFALDNQHRREHFTKVFREHVLAMRKKYPGRYTIWNGDVNCTAVASDHAPRTRLRQIQAMKAGGGKEALPGCTKWEQHEMHTTLEKLQLQDAFRVYNEGKSPTAAETYTQFASNDRATMQGQRIDMVLTDVPHHGTNTGQHQPTQGTTMRLVNTKVLQRKTRSDHQPVLASFVIYNTTMTPKSHERLGLKQDIEEGDYVMLRGGGPMQ